MFMKKLTLFSSRLASISSLTYCLMELNNPISSTKVKNDSKNVENIESHQPVVSKTLLVFVVAYLYFFYFSGNGVKKHLFNIYS